MKIKQLIITSLATLSFITANAVEVPLTNDTDSSYDDHGYLHNPKRSRPLTVFCDIDIEARTITSDSEKVNGADTFEIWDADGQACLQVFGSKEEFLDALAASSGQAVVIKLRGDGYSLKGYIII